MGITPKPFGGERAEGTEDIDEIVEVIEIATGYKIFTCGSERCGNTIIFDPQKAKPQFCKLCGREIDWIGVLDGYVAKCPKCSAEYRSSYDYCELDGTRLEMIPYSH